jgi:hypothetical protein
MGPLAVVLRDERVEARLLLEHVGRRGLGRLAFERQVHALVTPVLLRLARLDALDRDAEAQPPDRELAQP